MTCAAFKIIYTAILIDNEDDIPKFYKGKLVGAVAEPPAWRA